MYGETGEVSAEDFDPNGPWSWTNSRLPRRGRASWETWHQTHGEVKEATAADTKSVDALAAGGSVDAQAEAEAIEKAVDSTLSHGVVEYFFCFLSFLIVLTDSGVVAHVTVTTKLPVPERLSSGRNMHRENVTGDASSSQETGTATHFQESEDALQLASGRSMLHTLSCGTKNTTSTISSEESCYTNSHDGRCPTRMDSEGAACRSGDAGGVWSSCS